MPNYFSAEAKDLVSRLLEKDPKIRIGCGKLGIAELKDHEWFATIDWDQLY